MSQRSIGNYEKVTLIWFAFPKLMGKGSIIGHYKFGLWFLNSENSGKNSQINFFNFKDCSSDVDDNSHRRSLETRGFGQRGGNQLFLRKTNRQ